jgi:membrane protease YdiL (CAAX protease family)
VILHDLRPRLDDLTRGLLLTLVAYTAAVGAVAVAQRLGIEPAGILAVSPAPWFEALVLASRLVIGPMVEELFYRGLLQGELRKRMGAWAVPVQAVAFGFAHFRSLSPPDLLAVASATVVGLVLGWGVHRWRRLLPAILAHALVNAA